MDIGLGVKQITFDYYYGNTKFNKIYIDTIPYNTIESCFIFL